MTINGKEAAEGQVTEDSADVFQRLDLTGHVRTGPNEVTVEVKGETGLLYQAVGRHFVPHKAKAQEKPVPEAARATTAPACPPRTRCGPRRR
jgi:hypothetical protein